MVVFSAEACGYCDRLKREVLEPLAHDPRESRHLLIREFDINAGGKITDFDGERIRSRQFKRRYGIFATPTLRITSYNVCYTKLLRGSGLHGHLQLSPGRGSEPAADAMDAADHGPGDRCRRTTRQADLGGVIRRSPPSHVV